MSKAPHTEARPAAPSGLIRTVTRRPTPGPARGLRRPLPDLGDTLPVLGSAPRGGPTRARAPAVWPPLPSPDWGAQSPGSAPAKMGRTGCAWGAPDASGHGWQLGRSFFRRPDPGQEHASARDAAQDRT